MNLLVGALVLFPSLGTISVDQEGPPLVAKATASVLAGIPAAAADPNRPGFHFHAPSHWMNDPNAPIFYRGWYHVFYQSNPYGDQWGAMHMGHARSRNLVDWEYLPIALWPSYSRGEEHVFSGSAHLNGAGKPAIFYTSIGHRDPEQWMASPLDDDLIAWTKPAEPVVSVKTQSPTVIGEWRDPFLFNEAGATYMITGGQDNGQGIVALYRAENLGLSQWKFLGIIFRHPGATDVECPNLVKLGDRWLLLTSSNGHVDWFSGHLDVASRHFTALRSGVLAGGSYASQLFFDPHGRCIHLAWIPTTNRRGWNGFLTLPSALTLDKAGDVIRNPVRELEQLRESKAEIPAMDVAGEVDLSHRITGNQLEIVADVDPQTASAFHIRFLASAGGSVNVTYLAQEHKLLVPGRDPVACFPHGDLKLRIFLDRSALDVYAEDGAVTQSVALDPVPGDGGLSVASEGGRARVKSMVVYRLRSAHFDSGALRGRQLDRQSP